MASAMAVSISVVVLILGGMTFVTDEETGLSAANAIQLATLATALCGVATYISRQDDKYSGTVRWLAGVLALSALLLSLSAMLMPIVRLLVKESANDWTSGVIKLVTITAFTSGSGLLGYGVLRGIWEFLYQAAAAGFKATSRKQVEESRQD